MSSSIDLSISINEAMNKNLPIIIYTNLVEQEKMNMIYLTKHNASLYAKNKKSLLKYLNIASAGNIINEMMTNVQQIKKPNALNDLCNFVESMPTVDYTGITPLSNDELKQVNKRIKRFNKQKNK